MNRFSPVISVSGRTVTPGAFMSTRKYVMPSCLGLSGSVRAMQMPHSACWASEVQTFWPLSFQPPSTFSAFMLQRGEVGARARLGEQLAPDHLAAERGRQEPLLLLRRAVHGDATAPPRRR